MDDQGKSEMTNQALESVLSSVLRAVPIAVLILIAVISIAPQVTKDADPAERRAAAICFTVAVGSLALCART
jgi:uncharacterized membrane protein